MKYGKTFKDNNFLKAINQKIFMNPKLETIYELV